MSCIDTPHRLDFLIDGLDSWIFRKALSTASENQVTATPTYPAALSCSLMLGIFDYRTEKVNLVIAKNSYMAFIQQPASLAFARLIHA